MTDIQLEIHGKRDSETFLLHLQNTSPEEIDKLVNSYQTGNDPGWHRFIKGAYNHPITWWIGLFQLQLQLGVWGSARKSQAQIRANALAKIFEVILNDGNADLLYRVLAYNLEHRKADILGRFAGGTFTNYASTGGKLGNKHISKLTRSTVSVTNFILASYGASIKAIASGHRSAEAVVQSFLTGDPRGPSVYPNANRDNLTKAELELFEKAEGALVEMNSLTQLSPGPVPISKFCIRPENIDLKGLCK